MTRKELVDTVATKSLIPADDVQTVITTTLNVIRDELKQGNEVNLIGFGTFSVRNRNAREGTNPRTGEPIDIPASKLPYFKAGRALKGAVNK